MGRTNIEENAWRRIAKLAGIMKCSDREAAGTVACLWTDSQDISETKGTRADIIDWAHLFGLPDEEVTRWIDGLVRARFLTAMPDGTFSINGNDVQIQSRDLYLSRTAKATAAAKAKRDRERELLQAATDPSPIRDGSVTDPSRTLDGSQCNAIQDNAKQSNEKKKRAPLGAAECARVFAAYPHRDNTGKSKGLAILQRNLPPGELESAIQAAQNYAEYVKAEARRRGAAWDPSFVKMFSTWVSEWRDWVKYEPPKRAVSPAFSPPPPPAPDLRPEDPAARAEQSKRLKELMASVGVSPGDRRAHD